ncbi:nucleotidyltransferase domain-containing protein, partial [bacterium]|nr:nucleotidyltransferase domain-containing protein [bacterium]
MKLIKKELPNNKPVTFYCYGSYLYGKNKSDIDDIDVGIMVKGSAFKYIIDKITIPSELRKRLPVPVKKLSLFIYGEDNMTKGIPIKDTIRAGLTHKETVKRELSVAYWRNCVVWGKDFVRIKGNEFNALIVVGRMISGCRKRLLK